MCPVDLGGSGELRGFPSRPPYGQVADKRNLAKFTTNQPTKQLICEEVNAYIANNELERLLDYISGPQCTLFDEGFYKALYLWCRILNQQGLVPSLPGVANFCIGA